MVLEKGSSSASADEDLKTFGVYLGPLSNPVSPAQQSLLSQWDILVVDPFADGVREVLASLMASSSLSSHVIGRLDISSLAQAAASNKGDHAVECLRLLSDAVDSCLKNLEDDHLQSPFSGILLAGFSAYFKPTVINRIVDWIRSLGLEVWLELRDPDYLSEQEASTIAMSQIRGLVYRNATIRRDGDRQNFLQMTRLRTTMRAVAAQRAVPAPRLVLWETIDDTQPIDYAVVTRTYNWSTYNSALCWIGHESALTTASSAVKAEEVVTTKPLGALMWLKNEDNMRAHDVWRINDNISAAPSGQDELFASLDEFVPGLRHKLKLFPPVIENTDDQQHVSEWNKQTKVSRPRGRENNSSDLSVPSLWRGKSSGPPSMHSGIDRSLAAAPLSSSASGDDFTGLGCFQLGHAATFADFAELRQSQRRLRDLELLQRVRGNELAMIHSSIATLAEKVEDMSQPSLSATALQAIRDLAGLLGDVFHASPDDTEGTSQSGLFQIFSGLHSGFQASPGTQFWGLYDVDATGAAVLYLSNKTSKHRVGTVLHTFLSSRQCTRTECFAAEVALAAITEDLDHEWQLPSRLVEDVKGLSPGETLLFVQRLAAAEAQLDEDRHFGFDYSDERTRDESQSLLLKPIRNCCEYQLLDIPSLAQQRELNATGYLSGEVEVSNLIASRLSWLADKGCWTPDAAAAEAVFAAVDARLYEVLMTGQNELLARISSAIQRLFPSNLQKMKVDAAVDILALAVFSAFRRLALDEVYLEVLDRNVFPNHAADQAGCFAENFALGSRCDSFFDMTPRALGRILAARSRIYYHEHPPPRRDTDFTELPTVYAAMQVDFDPDDGREKMRFDYHVTFFGIFAVPAFIDVMLLTTIGRGLYLTTFMSSHQKTLATTALMMALLMSGSVGSWIGTGGCYYFYANAFPAMNMFVLTRFAAGLALTVIIAIGGFLVVLLVHGPDLSSALIFLFYFFMLSCYMLTLNALSIYQLPGSRFLSGRTVIMSCIPILFLSPVITIFTQHDIAVYLPVLTVFLVALMLGARSAISKWSSWYLRIPSVTDAEVVAWYRERIEKPSYKNKNASLHAAGLTDSQLMPTARTELHGVVVAEHERAFWRRKSRDPLVTKLAEGYAASLFLMRWYCRHKHARMPLAYSSTWNLTLKAGMENMTNMQKGLPLHSAFLHWRSTGKDIWAGFLYFIVALLDKWVALLTGGSLVGLSAASSSEFRLGVGFGLCYYLLGAISLDIVSQPLWSAANEQEDKPISSLEELDGVSRHDRRARLSLYWRKLVQFFFLHIWGASIVSALMWVFQDSRDQTIMFIAYIGAYSGLLWYQYNKIFCGQRSAAPLALAAVIGLPAGLALHIILPQFAFSGVIPLAGATWTACLYSFFVAGVVRWPQCLSRRNRYKPARRSKWTQDDSASIVSGNSSGTLLLGEKSTSIYSASTLEPYSDLSQQTLSKTFDSTCTLPASKRYTVDPAHRISSDGIARLLSADDRSLELGSLRDAFPSAPGLLQASLAHWTAGKTIIELVSSRHFAQQQEHNKMRAIARRSVDGRLHIFVVLSGLDAEAFVSRSSESLLSNSSRHWHSIAEAMVSATCELALDFSHDDAMLAELLVVRSKNSNSRNSHSISGLSQVSVLSTDDFVDETHSHIPEGIRRRLEASPTERARVIEHGSRTVLRYLLLGLDSESEWDGLPPAVRASLMRRSSMFSSSTDSHDITFMAMPPLSPAEKGWLRSRLPYSDEESAHDDVDAHLARCRLGALLYVAVVALARDLDAFYVFDEESAEAGQTYDERLLTPSGSDKASSMNLLWQWPALLWHRAQVAIKFLVLSFTADPEYQRELDFVAQGFPGIIRWPAVFVLNSIWSYCKLLQTAVIPFVLFHGHEHVTKLRTHMKGMTTVLERNRVVIESFYGDSTLFWNAQEDGSLRVAQYGGRHDKEPEAPASPKPAGDEYMGQSGDKDCLVETAVIRIATVNKQLMAVNIFEAKDRLVLRQREEYKKGLFVNAYRYEYASDGKPNKIKSANSVKVPMQRICIDGKRKGQQIQYSSRGHIMTGSEVRESNQRVTWTFYYRKNAKHEDELLWAEYVFPYITIKVLWSMPPRKRNNPKLKYWLPFPAVTEATFTQGEDQWHASWDYEHKFHPEVTVTLNGQALETAPLMITEDWYHVLQKPEHNGSFLAENPLLSFSKIETSFLGRRLGMNAHRVPIPTSVVRTQLWKAWKGGRNLDAISARWLDEQLLRGDRALRPYWRNRDIGRLQSARRFLDDKADTVMAAVDVDPQVSSWVHIAYRISDLYAFGQGGDASINTRTLGSQFHDSEDDRQPSTVVDNKVDELHILAMDTSTWPNDPGGVSACRRDMVNDLRTVRWHVVAECANDYGVPRFQIERNVQSLTILPLWGLDFLNPTHGVLESRLDSAVVKRSYDTRTADIVQNFIPILESLVRTARTNFLSKQDIDEATRALVDLNTYFETTRNWNDVWKSPVVKERWRELWLREDEKNMAAIKKRGMLMPSEWWEFERPSIRQLDQALDLWSRYLFIFSLPVPERIPDVFQASHHFTGATYGIVCKIKRNCTLHIWDHCISFREFTIFMSSAVSYDAPFVNSSLISLTHLSCVLLEHHADVVLPCCDYFNPGWEVELGTSEGVLEHRKTFARKIDPVVNGICNMEKFEPIKTIKTDTPTVVMLSHIQYVKDIKNAIMATDLIVNKWGFRDYRLHVYGDMERAATIATECQELIASKGLQDHCVLKGLGNPSVVLQDAWLFLNSSISEGLPLAMGEAALTGVPVVCTDVGASYCVVTDRSTGNRFSEVVPPNDSESLARAQISVLALLGHWATYAGDDDTDVPVLEYPTPSPEQVARIQQRMYSKTDERRALGMRGRQNVLNNFSSERYLREHEQMLWLGKLRSPRVRNVFHHSGYAQLEHELRRPLTAPSTPFPLSLRSASAFFAAIGHNDVAEMGARIRASRLTPQSWVSLSSAGPATPRTSSWLGSGASSFREMISSGGEDRKKLQSRKGPQRSVLVNEVDVFDTTGIQV